MSAPLTGRCTCGAITYEMTAPPLFTHCCHCSWCQRESGSAFALNAIVEATGLTVTQGTPEAVTIPTASGRGQTVHRCPACKVALYSTYGSPIVRFVRVGTLDDPAQVPPDVHIYTTTKLPWVVLPAEARVFDAYYDRRQEWPAESTARFEAAKAAARAQP